MESKQCSICKENKPLSDYYQQKKNSKIRGDYIYYNPECKECTNSRTRKWQNENKEKKLAYQKKFMKTRNYRITETKTRLTLHRKIYYKEYQRENKDKFKEYSEQHRNHNITETEWIACKDYFNNECAYCGLRIDDHFITRNEKQIKTDFHKEHVDHNGNDDLSNCVPSCKSCNSKKWQHSLEEWYVPENEFHNGFTERRLERIHRWLNDDHKQYKE